MKTLLLVRTLGGGHPLDFGGDDRDKAFITGGVLLRLAEYLRIRARAETLADSGSQPTRPMSLSPS